MVKRYGGDYDTLVFINYLRGGGVNRMEKGGERQPWTEEIHHLLKQWFKRSVSKDMHGCRASCQSKRTDKPYQPQAVVAVQMRNEDVRDLREPAMCLSQLHLRSFRAIHEKQFPPHFHHLG